MADCSPVASQLDELVHVLLSGESVAAGGSAVERTVESLSAMVNEAYAEADAFFLTGPRTSVNELLARMATSGCETHVWREGGGGDASIVACGWIGPQGPPEDDGTAWRSVGLLAVAVKWQGQGLASRVMDTLEAAASETGSGIEICVVSVKPWLVAWYASRGFVATGEVREWPDGPEHDGRDGTADGCMRLRSEAQVEVEMRRGKWAWEWAGSWHRCGFVVMRRES